MADTVKFEGSLTSRSATTPVSGLPSVDILFDETVQAKKKTVQEIELTVDSPVVVQFTSVVNAHVVCLKTVGGKVTVRLTSADGSVQSVPVDTVFLLISLSVPITAMDLTRVSGQATTVEVYMAEKA